MTEFRRVAIACSLIGFGLGWMVRAMLVSFASWSDLGVMGTCVFIATWLTTEDDEE